MADNTFQHAVGSGDPLTDRVILWTRVTTDEAAVDLDWTIARDPELNDVVATGTTTASAEHDHTVNVDVDGLEPGTTYHYRFELPATGTRSPTGRTKTLPTTTDHLRFAMCSCVKYNAGYFNAFGRIADRRDLDFVLHLGDYIYEQSNAPPPSQTPGAGIDRPNFPENECITLADYRARYAYYHLDPFAWHRFPAADGTGPVGCLWRPRLPCPLPVVGLVREAPTVVLLFDRPVRFASATSAGATLDAVAAALRADAESAADLRGAAPVSRPGSHYGLFLPVADWRRARDALASWPQYRERLSIDDTRHVGLLPLPAGGNRLVTPLAVAYGVFAALLLGGNAFGIGEWPLFVPAMLPPVLTLGGYALWHAWRGMRGTAGSGTTFAARVGAVIVFLASIAAAIFGVSTCWRPDIAFSGEFGT